MHVVLRIARPASAPAPADGAEGLDNGGRHHPAAQPRPVQVRPARTFARPSATDVWVLDRVEVDRAAVGSPATVRPASAAAGRRDRLTAFEGVRDVAVRRTNPSARRRRQRACGESESASRRAAGRPSQEGPRKPVDDEVASLDAALKVPV